MQPQYAPPQPGLYGDGSGGGGAWAPQVAVAAPAAAGGMLGIFRMVVTFAMLGSAAWGLRFVLKVSFSSLLALVVGLLPLLLASWFAVSVVSDALGARSV